MKLESLLMLLRKTYFLKIFMNLKKIELNQDDFDKISEKSNLINEGLHFIGTCNIQDLGLDLQFKPTYYLFPNTSTFTSPISTSNVCFYLQYFKFFINRINLNCIQKAQSCIGIYIKFV